MLAAGFEVVCGIADTDTVEGLRDLADRVLARSAGRAGGRDVPTDPRLNAWIRSESVRSALG
ncbi:MAG: hypothetical protein AAGB51_08820 [Planctomycetota bacterium]